MGRFRKYRPLYLEPERLTPAEARARRFSNLLERERRFADLPNFAVKLSELQSKAARSRVAKNIVQDADRLVKDRKRSGPKAASIAAALNNTQWDFSQKSDREKYRALRRAQNSLRETSKPSGSDKRRFDPTGKDHASTIYGTTARLASFLKPGFSPGFVAPLTTIPCIQRLVRREVMFAKGKARRGYHTRKRRTWSSGIPC